MKNFIKNNWILLCILALALFFRFWQINHLPGGLFPDEAANGLDINSMFHGHIQPFYERGNGREALFFYFEALSVLLFGRGVWQFHIVSAAFGFAAVIACYLLAKRLFGKRVALLSAFFMAVSSYAVTVTRTAFRATTVPLLATLTLLFLVRFFQAKDSKTKYWSAAWAGIFFGLGFYTYTSFRMMLPLVVGFLFLLFLGYRSRWREIYKNYKKYKLTFGAAFLITISWIAVYFIQHPKSFVGRAGEVSVFNKTLNQGDLIGTVIDVFKKTILSFFTNGDLNWRQNVSGFPFLTPLISPFFALAVIIFTIAIFRLLWQAWRQKIEVNTAYQALLAFWFWFMLVPEITTAEGIPHGLRLTGVMPVIFILSAWGVNWLWEKMPSGPDGKYLEAEKFLVAGIFIFTILIYNFALYFGVAATSPDYYYAFRSDLTVVSNYLNHRNLKDQTYLSLDPYSVQTTDYLTTDQNQPYILVDPASTYKVSLKRGDQVVFTQSTLPDATKFVQFHPNARLARIDSNQFGQTIMLVYQQP
ncbi:MAG: glycosyltransferase family 39 protein [Candidatus Doudnabacteria bacterium]